jgi:carboxymethylenebutenolidase
MCHSDESRPPQPPASGGVSSADDITLTAADGSTVGAFYARPDSQPEGLSGAAVIILPDVRGLHDFYKDLARRMAEAGLEAVAIDYFARTCDHLDRGGDFGYMEHVDQLKPEHVEADVSAAIEWLRALPGSPVQSIFTVGFCLGGSMSWRQSAAGHGLSGCVGFYGLPDMAEDRIDGMEVPLLMLAGESDEYVPVDAVKKFAADVTAAGVEVQTKTYPGAPHSFFDWVFAEHAEACDDAWRQVLGFIAAHN